MNKVKNMLAIILFLGIGASGLSASDIAGPNGNGLAESAYGSYRVGEKTINITLPTSDMVVMSDDVMSVLRKVVPENARLISGYGLKDELVRIESGDDVPLTKYAMVAVLRSAEHGTFGSQEFGLATASAIDAFGRLESMDDVEAHWNEKMRSMNLEEATINMQAPIKLGSLFDTPDAYGYGMVVPLEMDGESMEVAMGAAMVLVKEKILFFYLYVDYKSPETAIWLREATQRWVDSTLAANR
jgi:hypothetical protein